VHITRVVAAGTGILLGALLWRLTRYEIADRSMEPTLQDGDRVVAVSSPRRIRVGDVVVVEHPHRPGFEMVKRVAALEGRLAPGVGVPVVAGGLWVLGDNPEAGSVDSRGIGAVAGKLVRARVVARYRPLPPSWIRRRPAVGQPPASR